jgi:hypothetical protein
MKTVLWALFFFPFVLFSDEGLVYSEMRAFDSSIHLLLVDPSFYEIKLAKALDDLGRESVLSIAKRTQAVAAVNGGFFDLNGQPSGALKIGEWIAFPKKLRGSIAWSCETENQIPQFDRLGVSIDQDAWNKYDYLLGGAPLLIHQGEILDFEPELLADEFCDTKHARTAVGMRANGLWVFVVVDRQAPTEGMTLSELAQTMAELGCVEALNVSGGKGATLVFENECKNFPMGDELEERRWVRRVSDAFVIFSKPRSMQNDRLSRSALQELFSELGIDENQDLVAQTQEHWLRKPTQERWEVEDLPQNQRLFVLDWAIRNGLFDSWAPSQTHYDQAVILGGTTFRMHHRLAFLRDLWKQGVRFEQIVFLTGDRPLDPRVDRYSEVCASESDAAQLIWQEADLPLAMREMPIRWIAVPMKNEGGLSKRPTTEDTILAWVARSRPNHALFVSNQPYCGYQSAVIKNILPDGFSFELVGEGVEEGDARLSNARVILDTIARWLYAQTN